MFPFPTIPCFISETAHVKVDYVESEALTLFPYIQKVIFPSILFLAQFANSLACRAHAN